MTRPVGSRLETGAGVCALVLDGDEVRARLLAERIETCASVHVDWVRFTCLLRRSPALSRTREGLEGFADGVCAFWSEGERADARGRLDRLLGELFELPDSEFWPGSQAVELAGRVAAVLGDEFSVFPEVRKGHDYYRHRISIERAGREVGWVGFLASGDSPRQRGQSETLHVNLYGSACTFAASGWRERLAALVDEVGGKLTRVDLALDYFDGIKGGMPRVLADYEAGLCDVNGKRPKCNMVGDWTSAGNGRSFYIGSKEAGKQTNVYEKGHQLFGVESGSPWSRIELRYGNKLRVLPSDMLRDPESFFAGASPWHASMLLEAEAIAQPQAVPVQKALPVATVRAEVVRNLSWLRRVAGNSLALAFEWLSESEFLDLVTGRELPRRLCGFTRGELRAQYSGALHRISSGRAGHALAAA